MRHRKDHRRLGRKREHRIALLRNLVTALFQYERIETTVAKAKETRRLAERIRTGDVEHDPKGGECPSWCDLWTMCRVRRA